MRNDERSTKMPIVSNESVTRNDVSSLVETFGMVLTRFKTGDCKRDPRRNRKLKLRELFLRLRCTCSLTELLAHAAAN